MSQYTQKSQTLAYSILFIFTFRSKEALETEPIEDHAGEYL